MNRQITNPFLPLDTYIPDGEPHVFNNRLYIFGSQDIKDGTKYCEGDYDLYSCDINDLKTWRHDGNILKCTIVPGNEDGTRKLYAPDVVKGNDGRYYLYFFINGVNDVDVAVADKPEGPYQYHGRVKYPANVNRLDLPDYPNCFDPAVINDDGKIYLAIGFSVDFKIEDMDLNPQNTRGAYVVELADDMLTMKHNPVFIVPGCGNGKGTSFENHEFLEASSLRKYHNRYYFIYSSQNQHELCYAMADNIYGPYKYKGYLVSNALEDGYLQNNWANNHGSLVEVNGEYYIFYHRHTYGKQFSRQMCAEKITMNEDGTFNTAKITSQGLNIQPLEAGLYPAAIACHLYDQESGVFLGFDTKSIDKAYIKDTVITNITNTTIRYRYFKHIEKLKLKFEESISGTVSLTINGINCPVTINNNIAEANCYLNNCDIIIKTAFVSPNTLIQIEL